MRLLLVSAAVGLILAGCQSAPPPVVQKPVAADPANEVGDHMIDRSDIVAAAYECASKPELPFASIEQLKTEPERVSAGDFIDHYFIYAACPDSDSRLVSGRLYRKVLFGGRVLDSKFKPFDLKAGRWGVRARIQVPANAKPGTYEYRVEFVANPEKSAKTRYKIAKAANFEVVPAGDAKASPAAKPSAETRHK